MKSIIKFISLLLYSGLILPFYTCTSPQRSTAPARVNYNDTQSSNLRSYDQPAQYIIYQAIADRYFPEFKN